MTSQFDPLITSRTDTRHLRVAVWNCAQGFAKKVDAAAALDADLLVVPECARYETMPSKSTYWAGQNLKKGLAIFARAPITLEAIPQTCAPAVTALLRVHGLRSPVFLLAVWDYNHRARANIVDALTDSLAALPQSTDSRALIVAGDLNSNPIWDMQFKTKGNHAAKVSALEHLELVSAYHEATDEQAGSESRPTIFWRRHRDTAYHIDYVFVPKRWSTGLRCDVGTYDDWTGRGLSDHVPIVVSLDRSLF